MKMNMHIPIDRKIKMNIEMKMNIKMKMTTNTNRVTDGHGHAQTKRDEPIIFYCSYCASVLFASFPFVSFGFFA